MAAEPSRNQGAGVADRELGSSLLNLLCKVLFIMRTEVRLIKLNLGKVGVLYFSGKKKSHFFFHGE